MPLSCREQPRGLTPLLYLPGCAKISSRGADPLWKEKAMNWKRYFRDIILQRGKQYYDEGQVTKLSVQKDIYRAKVEGEQVYFVEIKMKNSEIQYMKCSCPYAASGQYCKHMAAALFAIEDKADVVNSTVIKPFEPSDNEYQYYDMEKMTRDYSITQDCYDKAKKLVEEKKIILQEVEFVYGGYVRNSSEHGRTVGIYYEKGEPKEVILNFEHDGIISAHCEAKRCDGEVDTRFYFHTEVICEHILALMILVDEYLKQKNPGDATDWDAAALIDFYYQKIGRQMLQKQTEEQYDLQLQPILERDENGLTLTLKAGTDKRYVVKNLQQFVSTYEEKGILSFTAKSQCDFCLHRLSEESIPLFEFLKDMLEEEKSRREYVEKAMYYYFAAEGKKGKVVLYGERIDRLFALYEGQRVDCNDRTIGRGKKYSCLFKEGKTNIRLKIEKMMDEEGVFHGVEVYGKMPQYLQGKTNRYYFSGESFCRVKEEAFANLQPFFQMEHGGEFQFTIGRRNLSEFYQQVLPMLRESVRVEEKDKEYVKPYIPPQPMFAFYLDAEAGEMICRPKVQYGEEVFSVLDSVKADYLLESMRNSYREEEILFLLYEYFPELDLENDLVTTGLSEEQIVRLLDGGVERLMEAGTVHTTDRFLNWRLRKSPKIKVGVSVESELMNLSISSDDLDQEELLELLNSYKNKKKYHRLRNGELMSIEEPDLEHLTQLMEGLQMSPKDFVKGKIQIPIYRALYLNKLMESGEQFYLNRDKYFKKLVKEFKTVEESEFEVPESLTDVMRNYQVLGFKWLKTLEQYGFGGILADDMGLGKTLQMISVLLSAKENGTLGTALIVAPASLVYNWKEEMEHFAPKLNVVTVTGTQKERKEFVENYRNYDVLVTSYDLLKRDIAEYEGISFTYQVLDEAQYIKNHSTIAAKAVKVIHSKYRFALTGTPIENRLSELWSIFDYLMPGFLYGYETFRRDFETPIVKEKEDAVSERLRKMVGPFVLRRLKSEVLKDLPDKIEKIRFAKLETEQQKIYDGQVIHMRNVVQQQNDQEFQKNKLQILAELTKIRQICCDPELLFEKYKGGSAKREACMELIQSAMEGEHKVLVFSQFTSMLQLLEEDLKKQHIAYYKITGSTTKEKRMEMVKAFNEDQTPVFLISLKAGGTGLNLIGADIVIHYDPWWNQAVQNQATDRAHRIGQTKVVSVYKLIAKGTIEEKIVKMQETKKDLADSILSGEMGNIMQMSKEELMELL